jgi:hypothetical protein
MSINSCPILTPYCRKESCDLTVNKKAYIISTISCALNLLSYCVINTDCLAEEKCTLFFVYLVYTEEHGCDK